MPRAVVNRTEIDGIEAVVLSGGRLTVTILPALGGKVASLVDIETGRELLWRQPGASFLPAAPGAPYSSFNASGIDECLPTIEPCEHDGRRIPDHGDLWRSRADWRPLWDGVATVVRLEEAGLLYERGIFLREAGPALSFEYRLTELRGAPRDYLWAFHDLIPFPPRMRILLPSNISSVRVEPERTGRKPDPGKPWSTMAWPPAAPVTGSLKAYARLSRMGWAGAWDPASGDLYSLTFDPARLPWLGIWMNDASGAGRHLGLEPANGAPDALSRAAGPWGSSGRLAAAGTDYWQIRVAFERGVKEPAAP